MNDGLWRVGSLSRLVAAVSVAALLAAGCSSGPGPADDASAATIIGDSAPESGQPTSSAGSDETPALSVAAGSAAPDGATSSMDSTDGAGRPTTPAPTRTTAAASGTAPGTASTTGSTAGSTTAAPTTIGSVPPPPNSGGPRPTAGGGIDTSNPTRVVGNGTASSCTGGAVVAAVAAGGIITFDCGSAPITIAMDETAKVVNANGPEIVIDGGGLVTLSGQGRHRILYQNTCDQAQGWTTSHCQNQDHPRLTVQNLSFVDGNASGQRAEGGGGGAIFVRGGQFRIINSVFDGNRCDDTGPDVGGAAVRVLSQYQGRAVEVSGSTFRNGVCSNGGALSSIGVSWVVSDSTMTGNRAIGRGANPAKAGTPGGGSGGAIYLDGNTFTLDLANTRIEGNRANEGGGAVFFVSNDRSGTMAMTDSQLIANPSDGFETRGFPGIFFLGAGAPSVDNSTLE